MPGLGASMDVLSGWAVRRKGVVRTNPGELSHTAARAAGADAGRHAALRLRVTQAGREQQLLPLARR
jgi:hypothetical protein